jgi:hypothetical protein
MYAGVMDDLLPGIDVRIHGEVVEFMARLAEVAERSEKFRVEERSDEALLAIRMRVLNIYPLFNTPHDGLFGQFVYTPRFKSRMHLEVAALRWSSGQPTREKCRPTYEVYVSTARSIFEQLIKSYNRMYSAKLRLNIESRESVEPKLPPGATKAFKYFAVSANRSILNPSDWKRFYMFAQYCHTRRVSLCEESLVRILVRASFSEGESRDIAHVYGHIRAFLKAPRNWHWCEENVS